MTVPVSVNVVTYTGNAATTVWPYTFKIPEGTAVVTLTTIATGVESDAINPSLYTITGEDDPNGGTVTYPLSGSPIDDTVRINIKRVVPGIQTLDLTTQSAYDPATLEEALDLIVMMHIQQQEQLSRAALVATGSELDPTTIIQDLNAALTGAEELHDEVLAARDQVIGLTDAILDPAFGNRAAALLYAPTVAPDYIRLAGYTTAGDGGAAMYKKVVAEPTHAGKFSITLADAVTVVWYEINEAWLNPYMFGATGGADDFTALSNMIGVGKNCSLVGDTFNCDGTLEMDTDGQVLAFDGGVLELLDQFGPGILLHANEAKILDANILGDYVRIDIRQYDIDNSTPAYLGNSSYLRSAGIYVYDCYGVHITAVRLENLFTGICMRGETSGAGSNSFYNVVDARDVWSCDFGVFACQQTEFDFNVKGDTVTKLTTLEPHLLYFSDNGAGPVSTSKRGRIIVDGTNMEYGYMVKLKAVESSIIDITAKDTQGAVVLSDGFYNSMNVKATDVHTAAGTDRVISLQGNCTNNYIGNSLVQFRNGQSSVYAMYLEDAQYNVIDHLRIIDNRADALGVPPILVDLASDYNHFKGVQWTSAGAHDEPLFAIDSSDGNVIELPELINGSDRVAIIQGDGGENTAILEAGLLHNGLEVVNGFRVNTTTGLHNRVQWVGEPSQSHQLTASFTPNESQNGLLLRANHATNTIQVTLGLDRVQTKYEVLREGAGKVQFLAAAGVTILTTNRFIPARYDIVEAKCVQTTGEPITAASWVLTYKSTALSAT